MTEVITHFPAMQYALRERSIPPFSITRDILSPGTLLKGYDYSGGKILQGRVGPAPIILTSLREDGHVWMDDSPLEVAGLTHPLIYSKGNVLTSGLGLGMYVHLAAKMPRVLHLDVVEREEKVIELIMSQLHPKKTTVFHDDIFHYLSTTRRRYDFIYLDIWPDIIGPIKDVDRVIGAASRCLKPEGVVKVWLQELINRVKGKLLTTPQASAGLVTGNPCLICGKPFRYDYAGLCMDCADVMGVSELFVKKDE